MFNFDDSDSKSFAYGSIEVSENALTIKSVKGTVSTGQQKF